MLGSMQNNFKIPLRYHRTDRKSEGKLYKKDRYEFPYIKNPLPLGMGSVK